MSNNSVKFVNIQNFEVDLNRNYKISMEFVVDEDVKVSWNDWIAIYPYGFDVWNSVNLELMLAYEFVLAEPVRRGERKYRIEFSLKGVKNLKYGQKYQFVYFSKPCDIYGISETFEFLPPAMKEIPNKSDPGRESDEESKENVVDNQSNDKKRNINRQASVKEELRKSEPEDKDKDRSGDHIREEADKFITKFNQSKQVFVNKQMEICSNGSCTVSPTSPPISCSNCYRVAGLLRAQKELYTKIKNLAEINRDLLNQLAHLQKRAELSQAACQKLTVTLMRERQDKLFYQAAVFDYDYPVMVVEPFVSATALFMPASRHLGVPSTHRAEEKAKTGCSLLKLKAIIGSQEDKIRKLTKEITQIKTERVQMVTGVVRDDSAKVVVGSGSNDSN